ncbi:MAG TPA: hypothetical protein VJT10_06605 [Steroidobacteraceae bacterium]|nr:hypothetical protein [Steroidobacteraceae bacterium]
MKTLITLSVLQTIGIAALVVHAFREQPQVATDVRPAGAAANAASPAAPSVDEERLRAVIREELARLEPRGDAPQGAAPPPRSPSADRQRRESIEQRIETYSAAGSITDAQMQELQAEIAKLDEPSRRQMMSRLVRALSSGDIKGRL